MKRIFAIGGGEISDFETLEIDKKVVASTNKIRPKALFIPTASGEPQGYIDSFDKLYGEELGCETNVLLLLEGKTTAEEARNKIMNSDIIYVGGGNTRKMLKVWAEYGVDVALRQAYEVGKILSGMSAGSICWFKSGQSFADSVDSNGNSEYVRVEGINLIDAMHSAHYNEDNRASDFDKKILEYNEIGIAIDNNCAIEFKDEFYKVHKSDINSKAYKVYLKNGEVLKEEICIESNYKLMSELLELRD